MHIPDIAIVIALSIKLLLIHLLHLMSDTIRLCSMLIPAQLTIVLQINEKSFSQNSAFKFWILCTNACEICTQFMFAYQLKYGGYLISDLNLSRLADGKII